MTRLEKWCLHLTVGLVSLTGIVFLFLKHGMKNDDPFSVVNHPLEPIALKLHILSAPLLIFLFGLITRSHIKRKFADKTPVNRRTGLALIAFLAAMVSSGYLLEVSSGERVRFFFLSLHIATGLAFTFLYIAHSIASYRRRLSNTGPDRQALEQCRRTGGASRQRHVASLLFGAMLLTTNPIDLRAARPEPTPGTKHLIRREAFVMGTQVALAIEMGDRDKGLDRLESFLRILEQTENELSTWRTHTLLARFNQSPPGHTIRLDAVNCRLFAQLDFWNRETFGAFDPALGNLAEAWNPRGGGPIASQYKLASAGKASGFAHVLFEPELCTLSRDNQVRLDAGGFGKGEALRRVKEYAERTGSQAWLVNFGGQIAVSRPRAGGILWPVTLASPSKEIPPSLRLVLREGSLATSGNRHRRKKVKDETIGHLLDPASGRPVDFVGSCTVWHEDALVADILSTALFVMGPARGLQWADERGIAVAYSVPCGSRELHFRASRAFEQLLAQARR